MGDIDGLRIALSALQAQRRALEVHGHNIANVGTEGYSRQRLGLVSASASAVPAIFSQSPGTGQGVKVGDVQRLRDAFLESRGHHEHAIDAALKRLATSFDRVELAFAEPGENGIAAQMADFLAGWDDVANRPEDVAARTSIVERGRTLAASFAQTDLGLESLAATSVEQLRHLSSEVSSLASRVAELNGRIQVANRAGIAPNDLLDERDRLVGQLGEQVGATVRASDDGMVDVFIGGTAIVRSVRAERIEVVVDAGVTSLAWSKDGLTAQVGGDASGLLATTNDIVPRYRGQLTAVATQLADEVNALHRTGFALDGTTGADFFVMGATGLAVSAAIAADPRLVAASGIGPPAEPVVATRDNSIARAIAKLSGPDTTYRDLVVGLGVESQTAQRRSAIQATITAQVDAARQAESGVDLDQELAEMLGVQHAYNAAARLMSAVDEALDTLVNRTGIVGR